VSYDAERVIPHRWWCGICYYWRSCGCFVGADHSTPYWLPPGVVKEYLATETRLHELAGSPPAPVRSPRAWTRALSVHALAAELAIHALAHARRCSPDGYHSLGEGQETAISLESGSLGVSEYARRKRARERGEMVK